MASNRQWILKALPKGDVTPDHYEYRETPVPEPQDDQLLLRNIYLSFDPSQRIWLANTGAYPTHAKPGDVMMARTIAEVVQSPNSQYKPGDLVEAVGDWQDYALAPASGAWAPTPVAEGFAPSLSLGLLGINGWTAYFGLVNTGEPKVGDTLLVSGAAGATGAIAGQIGRILGCRVIGIAGGAEKCDWLVREARFDAAIDYKSQDVGQRLAELCPGGVDIFFDNVGGGVLEAALDHLAVGGRIIMCGAIADYNSENPVPGPGNLIRIAMQGGRLAGFRLFDHAAKFPAVRALIGQWTQAGLIAYREDMAEGFDNIPRTFQRIFRGENKGKQLLKLD